MTSAGKLIIGTVVLTAAVATAKYLHRVSPTTASRVKQTPAETLTWRSAPLHDSTGIAPNEPSMMRLTSAQEQVAPPPPFSPLASTGGQVQYSREAISTGVRPLIPFSISSSPNLSAPLTAVDDEEVGAGYDETAFVQHTVQFGETLQQIALQYTGHQESYLAIYQANLDVLSSPADVSPGIVLKIPVR